MMQIIKTFPVGQCSSGPYLKRDAYEFTLHNTDPKMLHFFQILRIPMIFFT